MSLIVLFVLCLYIYFTGAFGFVCFCILFSVKFSLCILFLYFIFVSADVDIGAISDEDKFENRDLFGTMLLCGI